MMCSAPGLPGRVAHLQRPNDDRSDPGYRPADRCLRGRGVRVQRRQHVFIPEAIAIRSFAPDGFWTAIDRVPADFPGLTVEGFVANLLPVTIGNVIGGAVMVGIVYWFVYLRGPGSPANGHGGGSTRRT